MTEPGYIDYARTNLAAGYLIAGGAQAFTVSTSLFVGYLGSWPYINFYWSAVGGPGHDRIIVAYFSDHTFTTIVAEQFAVRDTNVLGYRQFAVLSPWVQITVVPDSATDNTQVDFAFYGTTQQASSGELGSLDVSLIEDIGTVNPGTTVDLPCAKILPGPAVLCLYSGITPGQFTLQRWDYGTSAWVTFFLFNLLTANSSEAQEVALPDAPIQATMHNGSAGAGNMGVWLAAIL